MMCQHSGMNFQGAKMIQEIILTLQTDQCNNIQGDDQHHRSNYVYKRNVSVAQQCTLL